MKGKPMKDLVFGRAVRIAWVDSAAMHGWCPPNHGDLGEIESVGYFVKETPEAITITHSIDMETGIYAPMTIPKGAIKDMDLLPERYARVKIKR